jgi:hypothetical protein
MGSKFITLLTRYLGLVDESTSSPSSDSKATLRNTTYGNSYKKNNAGSKGGITSSGPFDPLLKFARLELLITEY